MSRPNSTLSRPSLDQVVRRIRDISTLPHVALRVLEVVNDPNAGAAELKEAMENDPALSARVLRCVNSSAYAVRENIVNLQHAIAYLGLERVRNLAITAAVSDLFKKEETLGTYRRCELWRHLVSVGICARMIALRLSFTNFEDMFLAGLLHDIGIVLEDQHAHNRFVEAINDLSEESTLAEVERRRLGFDHTKLGERIAESWGFPKAATAAIRYHHASANCRDDHLDVVRCVELANLICTLKDITSVGMKLVAFSRSAVEGLSLGRDDILVISENLDQELSANAGLFEI